MDNEQYVVKRRKLPWLAMAEALMLVGGIAILLGCCVLNWVSYSYVSDGKTFVESYKGVDFGRKILPQYIEVFLIPLLGVIIVLASLFSAGRRRSSTPIQLKGVSTGLRAMVLLSGIIVMILAFEIVYRYNPIMTDKVGLTFWDNARIGWFATIYGGLLVIFGAAFSFGKELRKVGFADYWLVRTPVTDEPVPPPQFMQVPPMMQMQGPPPMQPYPQPMPPPMYGPGMPPPQCPSCGRPLDFDPRTQMLFCPNCNRYP
jgi:hypothetical protein